MRNALIAAALFLSAPTYAAASDGFAVGVPVGKIFTFAWGDRHVSDILSCVFDRECNIYPNPAPPPCDPFTECPDDMEEERKNGDTFDIEL